MNVGIWTFGELLRVLRTEHNPDIYVIFYQILYDTRIRFKIIIVVHTLQIFMLSFTKYCLVHHCLSKPNFVCMHADVTFYISPIVGALLWFLLSLVCQIDTSLVLNHCITKITSLMRTVAMEPMTLLPDCHGCFLCANVFFLL